MRRRSLKVQVVDGGVGEGEGGLVEPLLSVCGWVVYATAAKQVEKHVCDPYFNLMPKAFARIGKDCMQFPVFSYLLGLIYGECLPKADTYNN